jgi:hypothetical protein
MVNMDELDFYSDDSRVWVYQSDRSLTSEEVKYIQSELHRFVNQWTAHNQALKAHGWVVGNMFLFLMVDETQAGASGCSIDKSVAFIESLGEKLTINWFDRLTFTYQDSEGSIKRIPKDDLVESFKNKVIDDETLFFNTLIQKKKDIISGWSVPFKESWQKRFI